MRLVVVRFEQQSVGRTESEAFVVVVEAEADVEAGIEERAQLLGLAAEAVVHPGHRRTQFSMQAKQAVEGSDAVDDEGLLQLFAQGNVLREHLLLHFQRRTAQGVEAALADGKNLSQFHP